MRFLRVTASIGLTAAIGCAHATADESEIAPTPAHVSTTAADVAPVRSQRDGRNFPDGVLALTWDDGPDVNTLALAELLHREHVSATFFVVSEWTKGTSSDPGFGPQTYETGYKKLPLLGDLVALGHRVANHTQHHVLLGHATPASVDVELTDAQHAIDPYLLDELRLFRAPGGDWAAKASRAVDANPLLAQLVGPIRWDVDAKDWEGSVWCESSHPARECEHADGRWRVRADVMAQRYESAIESRGRGIVLMHDRVGDVGSEYALDIARILVPRLVARGYVFAAPVLGFGALQARVRAPGADDLRLADVDGDGRADACVRDHGTVTCATSSWRADENGFKRVAFDESPRYSIALPAHADGFELADVNGDGHADVCTRTDAGIECALAQRSGGFGAFEVWSQAHDAGDEAVNDFSDAEGWGSDAAYEGTIRFADVDGDGKADVCGRSPAGVVCARSTGAGFEPARLWLAAMSDRSAWVAARFATTMALGDVNGDGRADLCVRGADGIDCALSTKAAFSKLSRWTGEALDGALTLGDLNGDGRADVCTRNAKGAFCSFSTGRRFLKATSWLDASTPSRAEWGRLGDVNGDGRSDFCDCDGDGVRCGLAP